MKIPISKKKCLIFGTAVVIVGVVIGVLIWQFAFKKTDLTNGAVVTNGKQCSDIGVTILRNGGSAADATIAALFCEGVSLPQSMGLGGGFLLTIYNKKTGKVESLNSREIAPSSATKDMYNDTSSASSTRGGLAVAVPGELKGYWSLHQKYGVLPWKDLVTPTIELCRVGVYVTAFLARTYLGSINVLMSDPVLREIFIDPTTNSTYLEGQYIKRLRLARTLEVIAEEGPDALYSVNGSLINGFVKDIQDNGGIITEDDLINYEPEWQESVKAEFSDGHVLYTSPLPGSGVVLTYILNILDGLLNLDQLYTSETFQTIVESFKFGYGYRTQLGDANFNTNISEIVSKLISKSFAEETRTKIFNSRTSQDPTYYGATSVGADDHGTAHISVLAPNGDAVSVTSTINLVFGAGFASNTTGIILNDEMDDFSTPNSNAQYNVTFEPNFIEAGKRPLSSMVPSIILKNNDVVLVTGAAGGKKITTVVASIIAKHLWYNVNLQTALDDRRIHHQLFPMVVEFEDGFNDTYPEVAKYMQDIGHQVQFSPAGTGFSAVTSITTKNGEVKGAFDDRRGGFTSYI